MNKHSSGTTKISGQIDLLVSSLHGASMVKESRNTINSIIYIDTSEKRGVSGQFLCCMQAYNVFHMAFF